MATLAPPCADNPELFFSEQPDDIERAKQTCQGCWRLAACQRDITELAPEFGVWAGQTPEERGVLPAEKQCRGCHQTKPISAFCKDYRTPDRHGRYCAACRSRATGSVAGRPTQVAVLAEGNALRSAVRAERFDFYTRYRDRGASPHAAAEAAGLTDLSKRTRQRYERAYQKQMEAAA